MNICVCIGCPFANDRPTPPKSSGCVRYSTSYHCHLRGAFKEDLKPNEYWLFIDGDADISLIKQANDNFIARDESSQRRLWAMKNLEE